MKFGVHLSISKGYGTLISRAVDIGCDCLQLFSKNPRGWKPAKFDFRGAEKAGEQALESGIGPVFIHASYLVNLAAPDADLRERSRLSIMEDAARGRALGAAGIVIHPGSHKGQGWPRGRDRLLKSIEKILKRMPDSMSLILENTAGGGNLLGGNIEEFGELARIIPTPRLGFCLDTAHLHAAGFDIISRPGLNRLLDQWTRLAGMDRLTLLHLNDTLHPRGSRRDEHTHIGEGELGARGMRNVVTHPALKHLPGILETPKESDEDDKRNIAKIRELAFRIQNSRRRS